MCGICGIVGQTIDQPARIKKMLSAMSHRGPDDQGFWHNNTVALGVVRLSIVDPSPAGHQPMSSPDGTIWITYNGEIYNFQIEREILINKGYLFKSGTDTEVVLAMYNEYGEAFLTRLRGMFALAIYDTRGAKEKLILARDQLGIKPLLYSKTDQGLLFASELKAIIDTPGFQKHISYNALAKLLAYGSVPQPLTMLENCYMLMPGHKLVWSDDKYTISKYAEFTPAQHIGSYEELTQKLRKQLEETVKSHLVSDVPIGVFLSSGVDSAILAALMQKFSNNPIKTFTVGFKKDETGIDETANASKIAKWIGTDHTNVWVDGNDFKNELKAIIKGLDQPSVDGVNSYFVSKAASQELTVALSGLGADELFAGYPWFKNLQHFNQNSYFNRTKVAVGNLPIFNSIVPSKLQRIVGKLRGNSNFIHKFAREYQVWGPEGVKAVLNPDILSKIGGLPNYKDLEDSDELKSGSVMQRVSVLTLRNYTQNQLLRDVDAVSMSHSLEVRVPYLDLDLVNFSLGLPDKYKAAYKKILIGAVKDLVPSGFGKQKKQGFGLPMEVWLKKDLKQTVEAILSKDIVQKRGLFNPNSIEKLYKNFQFGTAHWSAVWLPVVVELWCQEFIDEQHES